MPIFLALATACGASPKPVMSEAQIAELREVTPGIREACVQKVRFGGIKAMPRKIDECFEMMPPQRWSGLWRDAFEGSRFCPAPATRCSADSPGDAIWLGFADEQNAPKRTAWNNGLYAIEFIGRRTARKGSYGHVGMSDHEIIVDRLISIKQVEPPRD